MCVCAGDVCVADEQCVVQQLLSWQGMILLSVLAVMVFQGLRMTQMTTSGLDR